MILFHEHPFLYGNIYAVNRSAVNIRNSSYKPVEADILMHTIQNIPAFTEDLKKRVQRLSILRTAGDTRDYMMGAYLTHVKWFSYNNLVVMAVLIDDELNLLLAEPEAGSVKPLYLEKLLNGNNVNDSYNDIMRQIMHDRYFRTHYGKELTPYADVFVNPEGFVLKIHDTQYNVTIADKTAQIEVIGDKLDKAGTSKGVIEFMNHYFLSFANTRLCMMIEEGSHYELIAV